MDRMETAASAAGGSNDPPALSLLLCTVGRSQQLRRFLDSLAGQDGGRFEVILVDQNEPGVLDATLAPFAGALDIRHVHAPRGLSRARNVGLPLCRGAIIGFPDDDCWYPPGCVANVLADFASHPAIEILSGRTLDATGRPSLGRFLAADRPLGKYNIWFTGNSNSIFVRREAALRVAGFDETLGVGAPTPFQSGEETDFVLRILATGGAGLYRRDLVVHHDQVEEGAPAVTLRRARAYSPGFGRVLRVHRYGLAYVVLRVCRALAGAGVALLRGRPTAARVKLVWVAGLAAGYFHKV
jgi:glycosyltransferase involved in cell wall biosynthesis